jgi:hypothetical protein
MTEIEEIEQKGTAAVKRLRIKKLERGHPFMINSKDLPGNQCYLEYPNGSIALVTISKSSKDFTVLRTLSLDEQNSLRARHHLSRL